MTSRFTVAVAAGLLSAVAAANGCCTSSSRAAMIVRQVKTLNRLHAEPAMRSAASELGAELLPVFPEEVHDCDLPEWPDQAVQGSCIQWEPGNNTHLLAMRDTGGKKHKVISIQVHDWYYARLARRGDQLFLLVPKLTPRQVDSLTQCDCDGMPRERPLVRPRVVFVVDGTPGPDVQKVEVPVIQEYVAVDCRAYLM